MAHTVSQTLTKSSETEAIKVYNPRIAMDCKLPRCIQPFLTWLTARPSPGENISERSAVSFVAAAFLWTFGGVAVSAAALRLPVRAATCLLPIGLLFTTSGLGLFQVVVFHHCSHGTVFRTRERNRLVGRWISALLLFKHFDAYQREHMLHHNARKLLTEEDEFADFVFSMCRLEPALPKHELWRRVLLSLISPPFHLRFLHRRIRASLTSPDRGHNAIGCVAWGLGFAGAAIKGDVILFMVAWVFPVTVLLQAATVFRVLCEHRFPPTELIETRGQEFVCRATSGVFPGLMPPRESAGSLLGLLRWTGWWLNLLTVQLFVRLFVLVGDAPCHDFHHRRPATKRWTRYIHARQNDLDAGCPGFPSNYNETWGLFLAIDENLDSLACTPRSTVAWAATPSPSRSQAAADARTIRSSYENEAAVARDGAGILR
jgi:fatty acid desaturase